MNILCIIRNTMPTPAPATTTPTQSRLSALGQHLRSERKRQRVSASTAAEAAGLSRVTLHRIEAGNPSVTMGAYLNVMDALGLSLDIAPRQVQDAPAAKPGDTAPIRLADYPQLQRLAWQRVATSDTHKTAAQSLTPQEALNLYERNWRHVDSTELQAHERALLDRLVQTVGGGRLLV
jgi:transcriptional regulator with XRE-family HTH domain